MCRQLPRSSASVTERPPPTPGAPPALDHRVLSRPLARETTASAWRAIGTGDSAVTHPQKFHQSIRTDETRSLMPFSGLGTPKTDPPPKSRYSLTRRLLTLTGEDTAAGGWGLPPGPGTPPREGGSSSEHFPRVFSCISSSLKVYAFMQRYPMHI